MGQKFSSEKFRILFENFISRSPEWKSYDAPWEDEVGVGYRSITGYASNRATPKLDVGLKLAKLFGVEVEEFLD